MKVLMVCLGNICRSPLAEGILQTKVKEKGLSWEVDSAGTGAWHIDQQPDKRSIQIAQQNNIDITYQRARQLSTADFDLYDLIFAMDQSNYTNILKLTKEPTQQEKVFLIMNLVTPDQGIDVPDPYWNDNGFVEVFEMLDQACDRIIERWT